MNKKTKFAIAIALFMVADNLRVGREYEALRKTHNDLVNDFNNLREQNMKLHEGAQYFQRVALAAFKKLPVHAIEEMQFDVDFLHIATKEGL